MPISNSMILPQALNLTSKMGHYGKKWIRVFLVNYPNLIKDYV
jgi:hypothetical protein